MPPALAETIFGKFLARKKIPREVAARELGVTRQFVSMLACGSHRKNGDPVRPSRKLERKIAEWAKKRGGSVPSSSWDEL